MEMVHTTIPTTTNPHRERSDSCAVIAGRYDVDAGVEVTRDLARGLEAGAPREARPEFISFSINRKYFFQKKISFILTFKLGFFKISTSLKRMFSKIFFKLGKGIGSEPVLIVFTIILGLTFGSQTYTLGWFLITVIIYEFFIFFVFKKYDFFFRFTLECVFFMTIIYSNWVHNDACMFDNLIYGQNIEDKSWTSTIFNTIYSELVSKLNWNF
jgi:hypothetical protein